MRPRVIVGVLVRRSPTLHLPHTAHEKPATMHLKEVQEARQLMLPILLLLPMTGEVESHLGRHEKLYG